ncbi:hypothetical protein HMSSN139_41300 [Paenibacillus sp. HMSSN-139]|nr:hypothetical protein HMSSN139_41300 [Paenibacillus sp. HMSSN-139]
MLILELAIILIASKLAGDLSVRLKQPAVLGKLLIGIVLGPALLGWINETDILEEISQIGVILLMFLAGLETDVDEFKKNGESFNVRWSRGHRPPLRIWLLGRCTDGHAPI